MQIKEKNIKQIIIQDAKGIEPIRVLIDEWQEKQISGEIKYSGHIVILCYGVALNHYFSSMGMPMCEFLLECHTFYLLGKFEANARSTFNPEAFDSFLDENDDIQKRESEASVEMATYHRDYICRIIEAVKQAFRK